MLMGIMFLILLILGIFFIVYGNNNGNILMIEVGTVIRLVGVLGIIIFIGINIETISSWFII